MDLLKKAPLVGLALVGVIGVALWLGIRVVQGPQVAQGETALGFRPVRADWTHQTDLAAALPFMAIAAIDVDGDGAEEIFIGGGTDQPDDVLSFQDDALVAHASRASFADSTAAPTYGAAVLDATGDGLSDLFVAREDGVWFYTNTGGAFTPRKLDLELAPNTAPVGVALGDINADGWVDLYVSGYIKMAFVEGETIFNEEYGGYSYLLLNKGDNTWADVSREWGVWRQHNTFVAAFIDLDRDLDQDLVVAQDTGRVEMYANEGDRFRRLPAAKHFSYPMGLGFGDYDNNGLIDLYFSNVGNTLPAALVRGDLRDDQVLNKHYMLLRNDGAEGLTDQAVATASAEHGFGWGVVMHDVDSDGLQDLMIAQNYARFPGVQFLDLYDGRLLLQTEPDVFAPVEKVAGVANPYFGMTPLIMDLNSDGAPDVVWANLTGPLKAFLGDGAGNHWLDVRLPDTVASLGAFVTVQVDEMVTLTDTFATSEGLGSDGSHVLHFGLGDAMFLDFVVIEFADGTSQRLVPTRVDQLIVVDHPP